METKKHIRNQILTIRNSLLTEEITQKSRAIMQCILQSEEYKKADSVFCYVNYLSEVETKDVINKALADKKKVACPKVHGEEMVFYYITSLADVKEGYRGIFEPDVPNRNLQIAIPIHNEKCLIVMPGAVFDRSRNRIGYGKGYYDKYLQNYEKANIHTIALAFSCQIIEYIPADAYDKKPEKIITEQEVIR